MSYRPLKYWLLLLSIWTIFNISAGGKDLPDADSFFSGLGSVKTLSCHFEQEQLIRGLRRPLRLKGRFYMTYKGDLAWIVLSPIRFYCVIYGGKLTSWDAESDKKRSIDLKEHPAFSSMIAMMKNFFAGKLSPSKDYRCSVKSAVKIVMVPLKHSPLAKDVLRIEISLSPDRRSIAMLKVSAANGDSNTMYFRNIVLDAPVPETVWKNGDSR